MERIPDWLGDAARAVAARRRKVQRNEVERRRLLSIVEHTADAIVTKDADGIITGWNPAAERIYGWSRSEAIGHSIALIIPPERIGEDRRLLARAMAGEITSQLETIRRHRDGSDVEVSITVSPLHGDDGVPVGAAVIARDITDHRQADRERGRALRKLAASERRFTSIAANVPGMVYRYVLRPDGTASLPFASAAARDIYELTPDQLIADPSLIFTGVHPEDQAGLAESITASAAQLSRWECHCRHVMPDGRVKHLLAVAQPVREPDGSITWDGVITDETDIRLAQAEETQTQQRLQAVLENLAGSAITIYDRQQRLVMCEGPLFAHHDLESMVGEPLSSISSPAAYETVGPAVEQALNGATSTVILDSDADGRTLAVRVAPYRVSNAAIEGSLVHWHDITPVRQAERARDEAQDRFRVAFERAPIGMAIVARDGQLQRVNQAYCDITGYAAEELLAMERFTLTHPDELAMAHALYAGLGTDTDTDTATLESRVAHASGVYRWVQSQVTIIRDADGEPLHALAQILDITERRAYEARLKHLADHDPLTGLVNRRGLMAALATHVKHHGGGTGALLLLDLDGFKRVNDTLGHATGDALLVRVANALSSRLRQTDMVARLGGDEFAVLLPRESSEAAQQVAEALIATVRDATVGFAGGAIDPVTASVGIALSGGGADHGAQLLEQADVAMYTAKTSGRNRWAIYTAEGDANVSPAPLARV